MTRFTNSPYEKIMTQVPRGRKETSCPSLPENHECYGCGNYGSPCVGFCHRELLKNHTSVQSEKGGIPHETGRG